MRALTTSLLIVSIIAVIAAFALLFIQGTKLTEINLN
jgi:VIT1/CCC1 family predicted Fe2+/Mn2+ transporter